MQNLENIGRELEKRGKAEKVKQLAESDDGRKLSQMLDAKAVETAAKSGDAEALKKMLSTVLNTVEGRRLAENVRRMMQE